MQRLSLRVATSPLMLADRDGTVRVWNRAAEGVFGYSAAEVVDTSDSGQTKYVIKC